jgi:hypothetical protein
MASIEHIPGAGCAERCAIMEPYSNSSFVAMGTLLTVSAAWMGAVVQSLASLERPQRRDMHHGVHQWPGC